MFNGGPSAPSLPVATTRSEAAKKYSHASLLHGGGGLVEDPRVSGACVDVEEEDGDKVTRGAAGGGDLGWQSEGLKL
jgi:hypothetical protein